MGDEVEHFGSCHCGAVKFKAVAPTVLNIIECNCSICKKKQNIHFIIPASKFTLLEGEDKLTVYQFNSRVAQHTFCQICGVQCFYRPRSNPDGYGVMPHCIDSDTVTGVIKETFCGSDWEKSMAESGDSLTSRSKQD